MSIQNKIELLQICEDSSIRQAMQSIEKGCLGMAILVYKETKKFKSIVTDGDIRRALLSGLGLESSLMELPHQKPIFATVGMSREQISALFSELVRVVPVLDEDGYVRDLAVFDKRTHLPVSQPQLGEKELMYVTECVLSGWVSSNGKFVNQFEEGFAQFTDTTHAISCSNCTTALHIALLALGIGFGDEVIVPTFTFIATANAVTYTGAKPVFVDSECRNWNMDPESIRVSITPKTRAILVVHIYGQPANMDAIMELAQTHSLCVIEDVAEAQGAFYKDKPLGSFGDAACFSFFGNKIMTTGEGGMLVTHRQDVADKARLLRDHGMSKDRRYWHPIVGFNYRMTNLQAALGVAQLERFPVLIAEKARIHREYSRNLSDIAGLSFPIALEHATPVCWLFTFLVDEEQEGVSRDTLGDHLKFKHIDTRPTFPCLHWQPIYKENKLYPVAEDLSRRGISLPSDVSLTTLEIERVCETIRAFFNDHRDA